MYKHDLHRLNLLPSTSHNTHKSVKVLLGEIYVMYFGNSHFRMKSSTYSTISYFGCSWIVWPLQQATPHYNIGFIHS